MKTKTILLAHGSSDPQWSNTFVELTRISLNKHVDACLAFMELSTPSIEDAVKQAKDEGYEKVVVLPLFLAKGRHLKKDVPAMLDEYKANYQIETELMAPIGEHPLLGEAISQIIDDLLIQG